MTRQRTGPKDRTDGAKQDGLRSRRSALAILTGGATLPLLAMDAQAGGMSPAELIISATRVELAAISPPAAGTLALLMEPGRSGMFRWRTGDHGGLVSVDPYQALHIASNHTPATTGCWVREPGHAVDARWAGARGDADAVEPTDNGPILDACLKLAAIVGMAVTLPESGKYGIRTTIRVPHGVSFIGVGSGSPDRDKATRPGTILIALAALPVMMVAAGETSLRDFSLNGRGIASNGVLWTGDARPTASNVQAMRFRQNAFVFDRTQNGTFINLCFRFNGSGICLLNGARNNVFLNATGEVGQKFYVGDYSAAALITLMIDLRDPLGLRTSGSANRGGNDLNRFFGGIFERAETAVRVIDRDGSGAGGALYGRTSFHDCEFTSRILADTTLAPGWKGLLLLRDAILIGSPAAEPRTRGTAGRLQFEGACKINGAAIASRGIGLTSNIATLAHTRTHDFAADPEFPTAAGARYTFEPAAKEFAIESESAGGGLIVPLGGPMTSGNTKVVPETTQVTRPLMRIRFLVVAGRVALFTSGAGPGRKIGDFTAGAHELLHACTGGEGGVLFARGDGPPRFRLSNITLELL